MNDALLLLVFGALIWNALEHRANRREFRALRQRLPILLALFVEQAAFGQKEPLGPPPKIERLIIPAEAQALALADAIRLPRNVQLLTRYVWIREPGLDAQKSVSLSVNRISLNIVPVEPHVLFGGVLVRVYLLDLVEKNEQLQNLVDTWELLRFCPEFNLLLTPKLQELLLKLAEEKQPVAIIRDGDKFSEVQLKDLDKRDVIRVNAPHLDPKITLKLQELLQTSAPIVTREYFEKRALESIRDDGPYKDIFGGLYYDFMGLRNLAKKGETDLDALLRYLGGQVVDRAENRTAIKKSKVTGKPRAIGFFPTKALAPLDGQAFIVITEDVRRKSIDFDQDALATLDRRFFKPDAKEAIWVMKNKMLGYALFDGKDKLQDSAPSDVVGDRTVPDPHELDLLSASSCIRCHEANGHSGWQPAGNDVLRYARAGIKIIGDASDPGALIEDTQKNLQGQYKAEPAEFLNAARHQYQKAVLAASGPWSKPKSKPTDIVTLAAKEWEKTNNDYWYGDVTTAKAVRELGFIVKPEALTKDLIQQLLPPRVQDQVFGITPADLTIDGLAAGIEVSRVRWSLMHPFAQIRAIDALSQIRKIEKKPQEKMP